MSAIKDIRKRLELGLRLYYRSPWVRAPYTSAEAPIIVGGCDRSGTTLLRATLDSHPDIAAGPESWVFVYKIKPDWLASEFGFEPSFVRSLMKETGSLAEFIDRFMDAYRKRENRPVWCEKSPRNILRLDWIWERFPKARVIHIVRDGRVRWLGREGRELLARHHPRSDSGDGRADGLGHEGHGARSTGVGLNDVNEAVLDGELDVHQALDVERQRHGAADSILGGGGGEVKLRSILKGPNQNKAKPISFETEVPRENNFYITTSRKVYFSTKRRGSRQRNTTES